MAEKAVRLSLDELFQKQGEGQYMATIEPTVDPAQVKLTPYLANLGCLCSQSIKIPKDLIDSVTPTGEFHLCCGKRLIVVEIHFKKGANLPLNTIFDQLRANLVERQDARPAFSTMPHPSQMSSSGGMALSYSGADRFSQIVCPFGYYPCEGTCGKRCYNPAAGETCRNGSVCGFGMYHCGCGCYNPASGQTCNEFASWPNGLH